MTGVLTHRARGRVDVQAAFGVGMVFGSVWGFKGLGFFGAIGGFVKRCAVGLENYLIA